MTTTAEQQAFLDRINTELAGSYTPNGCKLWWTRQRGELDGMAPWQFFLRGWSPDDPGAQRVLKLAEGLREAMGT